MIADVINKKRFNPIVIELFIRGGKRNISLVFDHVNLFRCAKKY